MSVGRVESVNIAATARSYSFAYPKDKRSGIDKQPVTGPVRFEIAGVAGDTVCDDRYHGGPEQAVYACSTDDLAFWSTTLGREVTRIGQNLTVSGIDCNAAVIGERWQVGAAVLRVTGPRIPCRVLAGYLDEPRLVRRYFTAERPGAYLAVEQPGSVTAGDLVTVRSCPAHGVTVAMMMAAIGGRRDLLPCLLAARDELGPRGRTWLDTASTTSGREVIEMLSMPDA